MQQKRVVSSEAMEVISERLSYLEGLYFPRAMRNDTQEPSQRKTLLLDLLSRDPAVFLERYGSQLTGKELQEFDNLKDDYEINWHLNHFRSLLSPTTEEVHSRSVTVKNRRRAYLNKLIHDGQYFSEDAMREREPYLHHEYVGKFQDPTSRRLSRPGERWSETLMRRSEEAIIIAKIRTEQQRLGVLEKDWIGNEGMEEQDKEEEEEEEEEEEDDEDDNDDDDDNNETEQASHSSKTDAVPEALSSDQCTNTEPDGKVLSASEIQDQLEQFTHIMQQKFLAGEDTQHLDYSKIDDNETLDDHWQREASHDAEEKYFAED